MSTQTKAVLLVAMLCGAHAERRTSCMQGAKQLRDLLQAHPHERNGVALEEDLAQVDDGISQLSGTCNQATLRIHINSAASALQKQGNDFNWYNLLLVMKDLTIITALIQGGCTGNDLQPGQWDRLKAAMLTHAPTGPSEVEEFNGVVADTFSLAMHGKLWKDQYQTDMPHVTPDPEQDARSTKADADSAVTTTQSDIDHFVSDISPHQVDPFDRQLSLLDTGSNTSQLVSSRKWNPFFFVGGILVGLLALVVAFICAMLNVASTLLIGGLNVAFGGIYCLIKKGLQMRDPKAEKFLECMSTNAIAQVLKVAWQCNGACGVWGFIISRGAFRIAFDIPKKQQDNDIVPVCFK